MSHTTRATLADLEQIEGKAELVNGEIILMSPTGMAPSLASGAIFASLLLYSKKTRNGYAVPDNAGFRVSLPHRESFSPDAAYYTGRPTGMKFLEGAPVFAAEIRSEGDYGKGAEENIRAKRYDYFAAGTLVVWDVDLLAGDVVCVYRHSDPDSPTVYRRGEEAEAEPAVPGWLFEVEDLFLTES